MWSIFVKKYLSKKYLSHHREPPSRTSLPSCPSTSPTSTSGSTSAETWLDSHRKHHFNHNLWHYSDKITTTTSKSCSMSAVKWLDSHKHVFECIIFTTTDDINPATNIFSLYGLYPNTNTLSAGSESVWHGWGWWDRSRKLQDQGKLVICHFRSSFFQNL